MAGSGELVLAAASGGEPARVVKWMADRTEPTGDTSAITIDELHTNYEVWCFSSEFNRVRQVSQLAGKIRKFGNRYYGIRLVTSNVMRLASRKR